jgi:hypothetical protein
MHRRHTDVSDRPDQHFSLERRHDVSRHLWTVFFALIVLLAGVVAYLGPRDVLSNILISFSEDTEYAPGYSERAFRRVRVGDTDVSVQGALGLPLTETPAVPSVRWLYTPDLGPVRDFEETGAYPDMRFSFTVIEFGEDGVFADVFGQVSHGTSSTLLGASGHATILADGANTLSLSNAEIEKLKSERATAADLEAQFGKPQAIYESKAMRWLHYARSPASKNYRQRLIGIDRDGKVSDKVDEIWWD